MLLIMSISSYLLSFESLPIVRRFPIFPVIIFVFYSTVLQAQDTTATFKKYDLLPAISYSPETKLTLGVIGYRYLDLEKTGPTRMSNINFVAVYTTNNQIVAESEYDIFTNENRYRFKGYIGFNKFPDRVYGIGNETVALVREYELENGQIQDSTLVNYLRFGINRFAFRPQVLRKVSGNLYAGVMANIEYQTNYETLPDDFVIVNSGGILDDPEPFINGFRAGLGLNIIWDSRDNLLNPRTGSYLEFMNQFYGETLGSDFTYSSYRLDLRKYLNPVSNHTLALRSVMAFTSEGSTPIPFRGLPRVGGNNFVRGYFRGTYQDRNLLAFETEYRLPFWKDDVDAPFYKFWKRLGIVAFISGAQVYGTVQDAPEFNNFNYAAGTGLRILFNPETRVNLRIDMAWGLTEDSNGPGERQSGLYFFLSEAF